MEIKKTVTERVADIIADPTTPTRNLVGMMAVLESEIDDLDVKVKPLKSALKALGTECMERLKKEGVKTMKFDNIGQITTVTTKRFAMTDWVDFCKWLEENRSKFKNPLEAYEWFGKSVSSEKAIQYLADNGVLPSGVASTPTLSLKFTPSKEQQ